MARLSTALIAAVIGLGAFIAPVATIAAINLPWIGQKTRTDCGRATLASLAARRGGDVEAFYRRIPGPADQQKGYSVTEMQRYARTLGVRLSLRVPSNVTIMGDCAMRAAVADHFAALGRAVGSNRPVVVPVSLGGGSGHYLTLVFADGDRFGVSDPALPGPHSISAAELARRMCAFGYIALVAD